MILKKPYAFLINNFRIIHGILFVISLLVTIKFVDISTFFSEYATLGTFLDNGSLASTYVPFALYIGCTLIILINIVIYYILSLKNKDRNIYLYMIIFYTCLIGYFIFLNIIFKKLPTTNLSVETVRAYRDVCVIVLLPQILFSLILLSRTLGFNLKQFDFKKDLEEMDIDVTDNEEFELTFGDDSYKVSRFFRKILRLSKYFFIENRLFVIILGSIFAVTMSIIFFSRLNVYKGENINISEVYSMGVNYKIEDSFITEFDINSNKIAKNKKYLLIKLEVSNKTASDVLLKKETFRLKGEGELLFPMVSLEEKFADFGNIFSKNTLMSGSTKEYYIIYELDSNNIKKDYIFKVGLDYGNGISSYKDMLVTPRDIDASLDENVETYKKQASITFNNDVLKKTNIIIKDYEISNKFKESYTYEINGKIKNGIFTIIPSSTAIGEGAVMKLSTVATIDESAYVSKYIKNSSDLLKYYGSIRYKIDGNYKNLKIKLINLTYDVDKYSYIEVPYEIKNAEKIDIILVIRGQKYIINLK